MMLAILDVNGTLFSLGALTQRLDAVGLAGRLDVWFARILRDGFAASAAGTTVAFPELASHHLAMLLDEQGEDVTDDRLEHVIGGFGAVHAHEDVEPGLRRLREAGVTVATMTNGTADITRKFLEREGLADLVDATYDVGMAGRWKPAPEAYHYVLEQHDTAAEDAALIAVHPWDIHGAVTAGLHAGWVDREGTRYPDGFRSPTVRARTFDEAVTRLFGPRGPQRSLRPSGGADVDQTS